MNAITKATTTVATLGLGVALLAGCSQNQAQVTWQDNGTPHVDHQHQQWWNYQFVYYPASQVYFEPHSQTYFWFQNGLWRQGSETPGHITLQFENPVIVKLETDLPYMQHSSVSKAFAASITPFEGSDLSSSSHNFIAYMDRYEAATNASSGQWATNSNWVPYSTHFSPFAGPHWYNATTNEFASTSEYTNGSEDYNEALQQQFEQSTAEAVSDQPDF